MSDKQLRVAVVGGSGFTGAELVRLILGHPHLQLGPVCGNSRAGLPIEDVLPSLRGRGLGKVEAFDADAVAKAADVAMCALPHGASAGVVSSLRERGLVVYDLSADFRLDEPELYAEWYGEHLAPERFAEGQYGLVELHRDKLREANLVAAPGCYPTASILPLAPLVAGGWIATDGIIIDAKSGVSGAGRKLRESTHFAFSAEGLRAYSAAGKHRHTPEIEQELGKLAGRALQVTFTPHLAPMIRGILATAYATAAKKASAEQLTDAAKAFYEGSPSVVVMDAGGYPDTLHVRGSNKAYLSYHVDERTGRVLAFSAIDNLIKGSGGQAIQALNLRFGFAEGAGLEHPAMWP